MTNARINHVSIGAASLDESVRFYSDVFGAVRIETPNFGFPVQWLRIGNLQLHIFERPGGAPGYHHFALAVDDFDSVFHATKQRNQHDRNTMGHHLFELPSGQVQLYIRDPGGNLVEVNCADVRLLADEVRAEIVRLSDRQRQNEANRRAVLYLDAVVEDKLRRMIK